MTRINTGLHPLEIPPKLLMAEHREMVRIPALARRRNGDFTDCPETFRLGSGHVKFFYPRILYLWRRYVVVHETLKRVHNYNVTNCSQSFLDLPRHAYGDYTPSPEDRQILLDRFAERGHTLLPLEQPCKTDRL